MQLYQYLIEYGLVGGNCSYDPNDPKYIFSNKMAIILMLKWTTSWSVALAALAQNITSNNIVIIKKNHHTFKIVVRKKLYQLPE